VCDAFIGWFLHRGLYINYIHSEHLVATLGTVLPTHGTRLSTLGTLHPTQGTLLLIEGTIVSPTQGTLFLLKGMLFFS
jgi:hypothetical protein